MADKVYGLTEDDRRILADLIDEARKRRYTSQGRPWSEFEGEGHQAPDLFVAKIPVAGLLPFTGASVDFAEGCRVYRLDPLTLALEWLGSESSSQLVYNLSGKRVGGNSWVLIERDRFGRWVIVPLECGLWLLITDSAGDGRYAGYEVEPVVDGSWNEVFGGRFLDLGCTPAWEANLNPNVPVGDTVWVECGGYDPTTTSTSTSTSTTEAGCSTTTTSTTSSTSTTRCDSVAQQTYYRFEYCCGDSSSSNTSTTGTTQPPCQGTCKWTCSSNKWVLTTNSCKTCGGTTCKCAGPNYCCGTCGNLTETTVTFCLHGDTVTVNCQATTSTSTTSTSTTSSTTTTSGGGEGNTGCSGCTWVCLGGSWILRNQDCAGQCFPCINPKDEGFTCTANNDCAHYKNGCQVFGSGTTVTKPGCTGACTWIFDNGLIGFSADCSPGNCGCEQPDFGGCGILITGCSSSQGGGGGGGGGGSTSSTSSTSSTTLTTIINQSTTTSAGCTGTCRWQWDAGTSKWLVSCSDCARFCLCNTMPPYSGTDDGETAVEPCSNTTTTTSTTSTSTTSTSTSTSTTACGKCRWVCQDTGSGFAWTLVNNACTGACDCPLPSTSCDVSSSGHGAFTSCGTTTTTSTTTSTTTTPCGTCGWTCQIVEVGQELIFFWGLSSDNCTGSCSCLFPIGGCFPGGETTTTNCGTTTSTTTTSTTTCTTTSLPAPTCGQCWWWKPRRFPCTDLNSWILYGNTCSAACNCPTLSCPPSSLYPGCQDEAAIDPAPISNCQTTSTTTSTTTTVADSMACWTCSGVHAGVFCSVAQPFPGCTAGFFTYPDCATCQAACPSAPCI